MENPIEKSLTHIHDLLAEGQFIEAMETYLHDDVVLREANGEPKVGKAYCVKFEDDFIKNDVKEFVGYKVGNYAVNGNHSYLRCGDDPEVERWQHHGLRADRCNRVERWQNLPRKILPQLSR